MTDQLDRYLERWADGDQLRRQVAGTVSAMAVASREIGALAARGNLAGRLGDTIVNRGAGNDQKQLDVIANDALVKALSGTATAAIASEEMDEPSVLDPSGALLVGTDPIDGSTNIEANVSIGTIFTVLPSGRHGADARAFLQPGTAQLAAGSIVYGPQTTMALTLGAGTHIFTLDPAQGKFVLSHEHAQIAHFAPEFAINMSNYRFWDDAMRIYIDDCLRGREGPRGIDFNMRWTASPVADIQRILIRGGIYLYPGDAREGFGNGRLRLVYEANPLSFLVEQAGGAAWNGRERMMEVIPRALHQRIPVILGSRSEVAYLVRLLDNPYDPGERSPLFAKRGLLRL